jgi:Flp pilus assembly pilin Flp
MIILIQLIFIYLLTEFVLFPSKWKQRVYNKKHTAPELYFHWSLYIFFIVFLLDNIDLWPLFLILSITHIAIDLAYLHFKKESNPRFFDTYFHLLQLFNVIVWVYAVTNFWNLNIKNDLINIFDIIRHPSMLIIASALIILTIVSWKIMAFIMQKWVKELEDHNEHSLSDAGKYIGMLERFFVFLFIIIGQWQAIGFLLAAKSVFRFGDLKDSKDRKLTEYMLIGTLISFAIATIIGLISTSLIKHFII